MITFALHTREMRPPGIAHSPTNAQVATVVRMEDASVSHDRILATSGYRGAGGVTNSGLGLEASIAEITEHLPLRFADAREVADALGLTEITGITAACQSA